MLQSSVPAHNRRHTWAAGLSTAQHSTPALSPGPARPATPSPGPTIVCGPPSPPLKQPRPGQHRAGQSINRACWVSAGAAAAGGHLPCLHGLCCGAGSNRTGAGCWDGGAATHLPVKGLTGREAEGGHSHQQEPAGALALLLLLLQQHVGG